jgi:hypothetical protein
MTVRPYGLAADSTEMAVGAGSTIVGAAQRKREKKLKTLESRHLAAAFQFALEFEVFRRTIAAKRATSGCAGARAQHH